MDEIPFEKSVKSAKNLPEYWSAEKFLEIPGAKNFIEYQYAKNFIEYQNIMGVSLAEMRRIQYRTRPAFGEEFIVPDLISSSQETRWAWDGLNLIAQDLLREGKPLPPALAEWVADVLADQLVKKELKRRPRPGKGDQRLHNRDEILRIAIGHLRCLFALRATRSDGAPPVSACDIVAAVMGMRYKAVEKIWNRRSSHKDAFLSKLDRQELMQSRFLSYRNS